MRESICHQTVCVATTSSPPIVPLSFASVPPSVWARGDAGLGPFAWAWVYFAFKGPYKRRIPPYEYSDTQGVENGAEKRFWSLAAPPWSKTARADVENPRESRIVGYGVHRRWVGYALGSKMADSATARL